MNQCHHKKKKIIVIGRFRKRQRGDDEGRPCRRPHRRGPAPPAGRHVGQSLVLSVSLLSAIREAFLSPCGKSHPPAQRSPHSVSLLCLIFLLSTCHRHSIQDTSALFSSLSLTRKEAPGSPGAWDRVGHVVGAPWMLVGETERQTLDSSCTEGDSRRGAMWETVRSGRTPTM